MEFNALPTTTPVRWTPERISWFRAYCPGHAESEISAEHERVFGTPLSRGQISNAKAKLGVKSGTHGGRFEKGDVPANKGKTWDEIGYTPEQRERMRAGQFQKGHMPHNASQPVGAERVDIKDGYVYVKVAERKVDPRSAHGNWKPKHHLVYEQAHGAIPEGCNIVFADRDKRNFDPENLVAVPRKLWSTIMKRKLAYHDADSLRAATGVARLDQAVHDARCAPRACKRCGCEFKPRFVHQRTCDACLGR